MNTSVKLMYWLNKSKVNKTDLLITAHFFVPTNAITCFSTCVDIGGDNVGTVAGIMNFFG